MWSAEPTTSYIYNCHDITFLTKIWEKSNFFLWAGLGWTESGGDGPRGEMGVAGAEHGWAGEFLHFFG